MNPLKIPYQKYLFSILFEHDTRLNNFPTFILRSVLGKELRHLVCLFPGRECSVCSLNRQCPYSVLFETPLPKDNTILSGRNFAPHPFILFTPLPNYRRGKRLRFELNLLGQAQDYFPYFYYALKKAGEKGVFMQRMPFRIEDVFWEGKSIMESEDIIHSGLPSSHWVLNDADRDTVHRSLLIEMLTPLRLKKKGRYQQSIDYQTLLDAICYRVRILAGLYGDLPENFSGMAGGEIAPKRENSTLVWKDFSRYSARQKRRIKLGGLMGVLKVEGVFSSQELSLLRAGELFHVGKNAGFGLGRIQLNTTRLLA